MPFDTYDALIGTVEDFLARSDFKDEVADFILLAEAEMSAYIPKLRMQDAIQEGSFVEDQDWIDAPADMIEPRMLRINANDSSTVEIVSIFKWVDTVNRQTTTSPSSALIHGERIYLGRIPGGADSYTLFYKGAFPRLSAENQTNFVLEQFPQCYLYGALANAGPFIGSDERVPLWISQAELWYNKLRSSEFRARTGGGKLRIRTDVVNGAGSVSGIRRWPF